MQVGHSERVCERVCGATASAGIGVSPHCCSLPEDHEGAHCCPVCRHYWTDKNPPHMATTLPRQEQANA